MLDGHLYRAEHRPLYRLLQGYLSPSSVLIRADKSDGGGSDRFESRGILASFWTVAKKKVSIEYLHIMHFTAIYPPA
jgi:hypothetical protein